MLGRDQCVSSRRRVPGTGTELREEVAIPPMLAGSPAPHTWLRPPTDPQRIRADREWQRRTADKFAARAADGADQAFSTALVSRG